MLWLLKPTLLLLLTRLPLSSPSRGGKTLIFLYLGVFKGVEFWKKNCSSQGMHKKTVSYHPSLHYNWITYTVLGTTTAILYSWEGWGCKVKGEWLNHTNAQTIQFFDFHVVSQRRSKITSPDCRVNSAFSGFGLSGHELLTDSHQQEINLLFILKTAVPT